MHVNENYDMDIISMGEIIVKLLLYRILQCTWGLPQTLLGLLEFVRHYREPHYGYRGAVVTECEKNLNLSLGLFVFVAKEKTSSEGNRPDRMLAHEYGHTIQSLLLGPLYLVVIGIPSWLWCNLPYYQGKRKRCGISYYSFFTETWADRLGGNAER